MAGAEIIYGAEQTEFWEDVERTFERAIPEALDIPHMLSAAQLTPESMGVLFDSADKLRREDSTLSGRRKLITRHLGRRMCDLFYEPSTRTRISFETAAVAFGVGYVGSENAREFSSAAKGETIEDTIRVINEYGYDVIVLRHHETGSAVKAAAVSKVPVLNAGDGKGEHPTQAILDAYTIQEQLGRLEGLHIVMGGDLKQGRTVRSLAQTIAKYPNNHISFVTTPDLSMEQDIKMILDDSGTTYDESFTMEDALAGPIADANVVYWTRLQKERLEKEYSQEQVARMLGSFCIDRRALDVMRSDSIIMHPLPKVGEIAPEVDDDPRAVYFRQAGNGMYTRMAQIDLALAT
ncbi:aspartate carbamoyltransferase [soil metagenome]